ncbi:MAG: glutamine-hydrolyzing GMP synthase, partial [Clostridia bacterium]
GVRHGARAFEYPVILRAVNTIDAMTATVEPISFAILSHIADRILDEVPGAGRVLYDLSPKPPATIEWE